MTNSKEIDDEMIKMKMKVHRSGRYVIPLRADVTL